MKHVAITFDDGRSDNHSLAMRIMDRYQLQGTVYITTGFIDGSWEHKDVLGSPTAPLSIDEIRQLHAHGWEIGLHGDKHRTEVSDMHTALTKLEAWGVENAAWGISVPNSNTTEEQISAIFDSEYGDKIAYVRRGRRCDTTRLKSKVLYALYTLLGAKWAYRAFNAENAFSLAHADRASVPSVVIKSTDTPDMVVDFIKRLPDGSAVALMLHSILPSAHPLCGRDPWSWEDKKFEQLCSQLGTLVAEGELEVSPLIQLLKG